MAYAVSMRLGDNSASELPENETETNNYAPWLEITALKSIDGGARESVKLVDGLQLTRIKNYNGLV